MEAQITNYGGIIVSLTAPDRDGRFENVVLGFDNFAAYEKQNPFFGCITGRYANRIANSRFTLLGKEYQLTSNHGKHHLHGGTKGFDKQLWNATQKDAQTLELSHTSPDGEEGYPGSLQTTVTYRLHDDDTLIIEYLAITDQPTIVNLTNHTYFNLTGPGSDTILDHELTLYASHYTPTDEALIPTGDIAPVKDTPLDFTTPHRIGDRIHTAHPDLVKGLGYDHNFILDVDPENQYTCDSKLPVSPTNAARLKSPKSGRVLHLRTTQPALQLYTGNHLGKNNLPHPQRSGVCLETQHYPDSPNHPHFPTTALLPGQTYHHISHFHFTTEPL